MKYDLGKRLKVCRKISKMNQHSVGKELSVTSSAISSWESGKRLPSVDLLVKLCTLYNVSADYLLGLKDQVEELEEKEKAKKKEIDERFASDYSSLDDDGKFLIRTILDIELYRCKKRNNP